MPKKAADKKFQIQNNLAPMLQCFAYTQTKRTGICFACAPDDMFSGFNTAHKAAWLTRNVRVIAKTHKSCYTASCMSKKETRSVYSIVNKKLPKIILHITQKELSFFNSSRLYAGLPVRLTVKCNLIVPVKTSIFLFAIMKTMKN